LQAAMRKPPPGFGNPVQLGGRCAWSSGSDGPPLGHRRRASRVMACPGGCRGRALGCWVHFRMFTARAITSAAVTRDTDACSIIASFAHRDIGIVSVGLNAVALVNDTYA